MFSHPELPWGSPQGIAVVWWLLDSRYSPPSWAPLGAHWLTLEGCNHCLLQHACLLIWQEVIPFLTRKKEDKVEWERKEQRREGKFLSTAKWHKCQEIFPAAKQWQGHLPSAYAAAADDLQHSPKGIQSGVRHSVLQVIWWNRSLVRYLPEPISCSQSLHHLTSTKALSLMVMSSPHD